MLPFAGQTSLRRKITLGYSTVAVLLIGVTALSLFELSRIEDKVSLGERTSALFDTTLEIRRFERNFFLHRQKSDYIENGRNLDAARAYVDANRSAFAALETPQRIDRFRALLDDYGRRMAEYAAAGTEPSRLDAAEGSVRSAGKEMVAIAGDLADAERTVIRSSLASFRHALLLAIALLAVFIVALGWTIARRIVGPLKRLEKGVGEVSKGRWHHLAAPTEDREIVSVTSAFNHMLRELDLRQKHLVRSEKLASLGTMLSGVAHELNNPLSNISTSCQILLEEGDQADAETRARFLRQIDEQTERARGIVGSLLDFARDRPRRREAVPLAPLLEETLAFVRGEVATRARIMCSVAADIEVVGDPQRLQQALLNVIRNAVEAVSDNGAVSIAAQVVRVAEAPAEGPLQGCPLEGEVVDLTIHDDGPGIAADVLPRIFDPFFTTKDVGRGMGLGLFIAHDIIEEHGGCIAVDSGKAGTTFIIRLPSAAAPGSASRGESE